MAPQYTTRDLVYYSGLFVGVGVSYTIMGQMGIGNRFVMLLGAFAIGIGCGWLADTIYKSFQD